MWKLKTAQGSNNPDLFSCRDFVGRQTWEFDAEAKNPEELAEVEAARQNYHENRHKVRVSSDLLWRMQFLREKNFKQTIPQVKVDEEEEITNESATAALRRAILYYSSLQASDGHWPSELRGVMFVCPPLVFCLYITGHLNVIFSPEHQKEMKRFIYNHQILGVFDWTCSLPMTPEFWSLFPHFLPLHPAKIWCVSRKVFMPMSYLYGKRFVVPITPLILALRDELLTESYCEIKWSKVRHQCANEDRYCQHYFIQELVWDAIYLFTEPLLTCWPFNKLLRKKAFQVIMNHIHCEDENSRYINLMSMDKVMSMLACWVEDPHGDYFRKHLARVPDYIWVGEDGISVQVSIQI
ncbi:hypothetical protein L6164_017275 [Bauhinia variegata]|uniref:Uncharacterized protein n=1 Tax=Bauhinia variegata TaxID=167791 RepID=A0ACB9N8J8_BAUVA|nr:hypothetical protein L6164_017275 [Bauhinia variegata]